MREITYKYQDPLDLIWIAKANQLGMQIQRNSTVFAAWDGKGTLTIGTHETLDDDDCLAQMIFHECCHALVEGPEAFTKPDWGLDITDRSQRVHEYACLRLQAKLADQYGLREFLGSTTNLRSYYDQLPADPLADVDDQAVKLAIAGFKRAKQTDWAVPLDLALKQTAAIASILQKNENLPENSLWRTFRLTGDGSETGF